MLVQPKRKPKMVTVSKRLLVELCNNDWPDELTTSRLNTLFTMINCAQRHVADDWDDDSRGKAYWRRLKSIKVRLGTKKASKWCECKTPQGFYKQLTMFKVTERPIVRGSLNIPTGQTEQKAAIALQPMPPPILNLVRFKNSAGRELVTVSLDMSWVHVKPLFVKVPLPLPVGKKSRVVRHLAKALRRAPV